MDTPFLPEVVMENIGPEVKSFIYQVIQEFEPFTTPESVVTVTAKNPLGLLNAFLEGAGGEMPPKESLKKMYRIEISISESGSSISAEGLHEDIYESIKLAKDKLLKMLTEIQDDLISPQDRRNQIRHALASGGDGSVH